MRNKIRKELSSIIKCPECGTDNPNYAKFCKNCGSNLEEETPTRNEEREESKAERYDEYSEIQQQNIDYNRLTVGIIVVIGLLFIVGALILSGGEEAESSEKIEILEHELVREDEGTIYEEVYVRGKAQNVSGKEISEVQIGIIYYDESGARIESMHDWTSNLADQEVWNFEVMSLGGEIPERVDHYKISIETIP